MISSTLEINAPPSRVREVLLTFSAYPTWHTGFIDSIAKTDSTDPAPSTTITLAKEESEDATTSSPDDGTVENGNFVGKGDHVRGVMGGVNFNAVIVESSPNVLTWTGPPLYHLFRGIHTFRFSPSESGGTTFVQEESFVGWGAWVMAEKGPVGKKVKGMFETFNADLKREAERKG